MSEKIVVPALGESVTEATVSRWLKSVGEKGLEMILRTATIQANFDIS